MDSTKRITELMGQMKAFGKEKYLKSEVLPELFELQQEIVELTFSRAEMERSELRIWDVEKRLEELNSENGHVADEELRAFKAGSKELSNLIKGLISGNRGEAKAYYNLQLIENPKTILRNIELHEGDAKAELDAIVITRGGITIVEVKNTGRDIFIDEYGDFYRTGEFLRWDSNIAEKMRIRELLLRNVLQGQGIDNVHIRSLIVFTNNKIQVQNRCPQISTCFLSQLPFLAGNTQSMSSNCSLSSVEMKRIENSIRGAERKDGYKLEFDALTYKHDFAVLLAKLEAEAERKKARDLGTSEHKPGLWKTLRSAFRRKELPLARVAGFATILVTELAANAFKKGGF